MPLKIHDPVKPPSGLKKAGKDLWREVLAIWERLGVDPLVNLPGLRLAAQAADQLERAKKKLDELGSPGVPVEGGFAYDPQWAAYCHNSRLLLALLNDLGVTPAAQKRQKLGAKKEGPAPERFRRGALG